MRATVAFLDDRDDQRLEHVTAISVDGDTVYVEFHGPDGEVYGEQTYHDAYIADAVEVEDT